MKQQKIQIIKIEADEGMILTNGQTYSTSIYLGAADNVENWWEIPESEREQEQGEI